MIRLLFLLVFTESFSHATEYIYPIGVVPQSAESKVLFMHQHADRRTQVFLWDSITQTYEVSLSSQYNPIGVQLLPNGTGFSFIDDGIIKLKFFNKRSAKIIEIYEPLYNIAQITWISDTDFLFQAKRSNHYGIYQSDLGGNITSVKTDLYTDYGYPTLIDDTLFYLSKNVADVYTIAYDHYPVDQKEKVGNVLYVSDHPLMYLTMLSTNEGYVVEKNGTTTNICFFKLEKEQWKFEKIFALPDSGHEFFDNNNVLCEVLRTSLPREHEGRLFLPVARKNVKAMLSYYDRDFGCLVEQFCASFFLPPTLKNNCSYSFFGSPILTQNNIFVGICFKA